MDQTEIEQHLEKIVSKGFTSRGKGEFGFKAERIAKNYLKDKFGGAEIASTAQDAFSAAISKIYAINKSGSSEKLASAKTTKEIEGYVIKSITNYCLTLRARLVKYERTDSPFEDSSRHSDSESHIQVSLPDSSNSSSELLSSVQNNNFSLNYLDTDNLASTLRERKLSDEEIQIIQRRLSGESFPEMSRESSHSADRYRKIFNRAIKKADIESVKEFL
tara:strand:- start:34340 stop:34996 length:657 start_codon:yes stop_codon:yes gene_type:complete